MELITFCKACRKSIKVKSRATSRAKLEREKGREFLVNCTHCGKNNPKHVNDIRARENKVVMMSAGALGILLALILLFIFGAIGTLVITIPIFIWKQQTEAVGRFNRYLLPRH